MADNTDVPGPLPPKVRLEEEARKKASDAAAAAAATEARDRRNREGIAAHIAKSGSTGSEIDPDAPNPADPKYQGLAGAGRLNADRKAYREKKANPQRDAVSRMKREAEAKP